MSTSIEDKIKQSDATKNDSASALLPYSMHFEKEMLGMLLRDTGVIDQLGHISGDWFFEPVNQKIFHSIEKIIQSGSGSPIPIISIDLESDKDFETAGGKKYLEELAWDLTITTPKDCASILSALRVKRKLMEVGEELVMASRDAPLSDLTKKVDEAESKLYSLSSGAGKSEFVAIDKPIVDILKKFDVARKDRNHIFGVKTNLTDLDRLLGGFKKSDLVILAARPSMGKTALAATIAYNIAQLSEREESEGGGIAFFSLEMSVEQIALRIMSMHSNVNTRMLQTGRNEIDASMVSDEDFKKIADSIAGLQKLPLYIDDTPAITISNLHTKARRMKRKYNISAIFIDYLQLIRGRGAKNDNRVQEISEITQSLKAIAKELEIPVIALSQLSRGVEARDNKRPQLSDLRESGSIEQDADIVMFLYREVYYLERDKPEEPSHVEPNEPGEFLEWQKQKLKYEAWDEKIRFVENLAELIVAKNRNGSIGTVNLSFNRERTLFENRMQEGGFHGIGMDEDYFG